MGIGWDYVIPKGFLLVRIPKGLSTVNRRCHPERYWKHRICSMLRCYMDDFLEFPGSSEIEDNWADMSVFLEGQEKRSCTFLAKPV